MKRLGRVEIAAHPRAEELLEAGCGTDCSGSAQEWQRPVPPVEMAKGDFTPSVQDLHERDLALARQDTASTSRAADFAAAVV